MAMAHILSSLGLLLCVVYTYSAPTSQNGFSFASYYNDHMVLQRAPQRANIWGHSTKLNDVVHVEVKGSGVYHTVQTQVHKGPDGKGMWKVALPAVQAGGPYTVTAKSSLATLTIHDVLFGDVWICSGQSNMHFTLSMGFNATQEEADGANYPNIRLFTERNKESKTLQQDLLAIEQNWSLPSKSSLGGNPWSHFSSVCWFYGKELYKELKHPIGLMVSRWGATLIESWSSPDALSKCGAPLQYKPEPGFPRNPSVLWNSMIHPLLPFTIYGAIWYQGESNNDHPARYNCSFPAMIDDWREKFNKESGGQTSRNFPFGFVQLAAVSKWPSFGFTDLRWSQTAGYGYVPNKRMQNVFMSVALDTPDYDSPYGSIHPRHKKVVSHRLALGGLAVGYHKQGIKYQGPYPSTITHQKSSSTVTIEFDHGKTPLDIRSHDGFEVCCRFEYQNGGCLTTDDSWHPAPIKSSTKTSVVIHYPDWCNTNKMAAKAVRYIWKESPCVLFKCPVYSVANGLPTPPFKYFLKDNSQVHIVG